MCTFRHPYMNAALLQATTTRILAVIEENPILLRRRFPTIQEVIVLNKKRLAEELMGPKSEAHIKWDVRRDVKWSAEEG